jgi:hypothetical protein
MKPRYTALWGILPIMALLFFNFLFTVGKNLQILSNDTARNPKIAQKFVHAHIPTQSRVVGDPTYYFAVIANGSDYQYNDLFNSLANREKLQREKYDYQYLIVTDIQSKKRPDIPTYYQSKDSLTFVARLSIRYEPTYLDKLFSIHEQSGYNAVIYKRR